MFPLVGFEGLELRDYMGEKKVLFILLIIFTMCFAISLMLKLGYFLFSPFLAIALGVIFSATDSVCTLQANNTLTIH